MTEICIYIYIYISIVDNNYVEIRVEEVQISKVNKSKTFCSPIKCYLVKG